MLFYSLFKSLINERVIVELKSNLVLSGKIEAVDQFLNLQLTDVEVAEANIEINPSLMLLGNCFIRGSMIRYVQLPPAAIDKDLLQEATRLEADAVARGSGSEQDSGESDSADGDSMDPEDVVVTEIDLQPNLSVF